MLGSAIGPSQKEYDEIQAAYKDSKISLNSYIKELNSTALGVGDLKDQINYLEAENTKLQEKVDEAAPFFKLKDEERKQKEAEAKEAEEKRLADEKAKKEKQLAEEKAEKEAKEKELAEAKAREKEAAEAEERKGYDTGISYDQIARNPDDYLGNKVKFYGKVLQVMEGDYETQIRLAVDGDYDKVVYASFDPTILSSRILEDDNITIMGLSSGIISYTSTLGGKISIPGILVEKIEL